MITAIDISRSICLCCAALHDRHLTLRSLVGIKSACRTPPLTIDLETIFLDIPASILSSILVRENLVVQVTNACMEFYTIGVLVMTQPLDTEVDTEADSPARQMRGFKHEPIDSECLQSGCFDFLKEHDPNLNTNTLRRGCAATAQSLTMLCHI